MEITLTLLILLIAIILFATEWIPMDMVSLMVLLAEDEHGGHGDDSRVAESGKGLLGSDQAGQAHG